MQSEDVELVRSRTSLVDLVAQRVSLKRLGKNWKGLCPFHDDHHPSFDVSDELGRYRCWSCGAKGDIFTWVIETQKVEFQEALEILAKQAGVKLSTKQEVKSESSKKRLYEQMMDSALEYFQQTLSSSQEAKNYCKARGLDQEVCAHWKIGYAPREGEGSAIYLKKKGYLLQDAKALFLVEQDGQGGYYDRFRGRLMFPIFDARGAVVAFGGRALGDGQPKYVNSSDTPLFSKRRLLYGMHEAKSFISKLNQAVLVEGYLDVIACHRAGVKEAVASLGTAFSEDHAKLLKKWCEKVSILYDSDKAGQDAAARASEILEKAGVHVRVALMPEGEDPDSLLRSGGGEAVQKACREGLSPLGFKVFQVQKKFSTSDESYWKQVTEVLAVEQDPLEFEKYLLMVSAQYPGLRDPAAAQRALRKKVMTLRKTRSSSGKKMAASPQKEQSKKRLFHSCEEALFLGFLSSDQSVRSKAWTILSEDGEFFTALGGDVVKAITKSFSSAPVGEVSEWIGQIQPETSQESLVELAFRSSVNVDLTVLEDVQKRLAEFREKKVVAGLRGQQGAHDEAVLEEIYQRLQKLKT